MAIKNVVFDIGNVLVEWQPVNIIANFLKDEQMPEEIAKKMFKSQTWLDLNLGKKTIKEAIEAYNNELGIPKEQLRSLMAEAKYSQVPIEGSVELLNELYNLGIPLYSITDNLREIVTHLKQKYDFFDKFKDIIVSAELGVLKPSAIIYHHLIDKYNLVPEESVFIDDIQRNVEGAIAIGMKGIQFIDAASCRKELKALGLALL